MMPDRVLEQLEKGADARKRRNLDLVYEICREQHEQGSKDFALSTIGRLSQQRGGPVARRSGIKAEATCAPLSLLGQTMPGAC